MASVSLENKGLRNEIVNMQEDLLIDKCDISITKHSGVNSEYPSQSQNPSLADEAKYIRRLERTIAKHIAKRNSAKGTNLTKGDNPA